MLKMINTEKWYRKISPVEWITIAISIISLGFSSFNFVNKVNYKRNYDKTATQVLINAENVEINDIQGLFDIVYHSEDKAVTLDEVNIFLGNMKDNYKIVSDLNISDLPKNKILNYQLISMDMNANINGFTKVFNQYKKDNTKQINFGNDKENVLSGLYEARKAAIRDKKTLKAGKKLQSETFDQSEKNFENAYREIFKNFN